MKETTRVIQETKELTAQLAIMDKQLKEIDEKRDEIIGQVNKQRNEIFEQEKSFNDAMRQYELEKEKDVVLNSDK